jgi:hypothetical protein
MDKVIRPGTIDGHSVYIRIKTEQKEKGICLSISGVVGPRPGGNAWGSCGQIQNELRNINKLAPGWTREMVDKLFEVWERWHLNDMNAACPHQTGPEWDTSRPISFVGFQKTDKAKKLRDLALKSPLSPEDYKIIALVEEYHGESLNAESIPEEVTDLILTGYLEPWHWDHIEKTERAGWIDVSKGGLLSKPCSICGYKYGTAWLFEEIPTEVLQWLGALPDTDEVPAWV